MISYLAAALASFLYIALKATQQRQVMHAQYARMPLVSVAMAFCEIFIMANVVHTSDNIVGLSLLAVSIGVGGGAGSVIGTWMHVQKHGGGK